MKQRKTFTSWLISRYLLIIRDEENFAERGTITFSISMIFLIIMGLLIILTTISFFVATTFLGKLFDPRVEYQNINQQLITVENQIDSLERQVEIKDQFIDNIKNIMEGNIAIENEESYRQDAASFEINSIDLENRSSADSLLRQEFEDVDYDLLTMRNNARDDLSQMYFFPPLQGVISDGYSVQKRHYAIDIVAKANEPIKAVADGTVIISSWTQDSGYVLGIQHKGELISFYKHNSVLLKKVGEIVKAGDPIAIVGNSGELTDGPHLHFELWYNGNPVDPEEFISF